MNSKRQSLSYAETLAAILSAANPLEVIHTNVLDANGKALATPIYSTINVPPWDNSAMDGYATKRAYLAGVSSENPISLKLAGTIAAGDPVRSLPANEGTCIQIMTGAPIPIGADCVVRVEDTNATSDTITVYSGRDTLGRGNVRPKGEDIREGELLFPQGTTVSSSHMGALASAGHSLIPIHRAPRIALISSGNELALLNHIQLVRDGEKVVSSTSYSLPTLLAMAGADVTVLPIVSDSHNDLARSIEKTAGSDFDVIITTGGVSVGLHDYTRNAVVSAGGVVTVPGSRIRPGGPIAAGTIHDKVWLGLPGNPVSSMVTAYLFAWPLIKALGGHTNVHHFTFQARMLNQADTSLPLTYFLRVLVQRNANGLAEATLAGNQGSNLLSVLAKANALLIVSESVNSVNIGEMYDVIMLPSQHYGTVSYVNALEYGLDNNE